MGSRVPMSMALIASVSLSLGMSKEAQASDVAAPATTAENVLNLTADDIDQLNQMGFDPQAVSAELTEMEETYGPVDPRDLQRQVSQDMQRTVGDLDQPEVHQRYMEQLRERYEGNGHDANRVRLVIAENKVDNETIRIKGIGLRYEREF